MLPSGQPLWQKGIPQSMQRAPCSRSFSSGNFRSYSCQSLMRSRTGRRGVVSRAISMKPVILPIETALPTDYPTDYPLATDFFHDAPPFPPLHFLLIPEKSHSCRDRYSHFTRRPLTNHRRLSQMPLYGCQPRHIRLHIELALKYAPILSRHHLDELAYKIVPVIQDAPGNRASGVLMMTHQQGVNMAHLGRVGQIVQFDHAHVAARLERSVLIEYVGDA